MSSKTLELSLELPQSNQLLQMASLEWMLLRMMKAVLEARLYLRVSLIIQTTKERLKLN